MKPTPRLALLTLCLGLLSACSTETRQAPIVDRPTASAPRFRPVTPSTPAADDLKPDARGTYTVRRGDTLLRIALDHGQNYRDLIAWNNLSDPNDIKVGQVLRVAPLERGAANGNVANAANAAGSAAVVTSPISMPGADKPAAPARKSAPRGDKKPYNESNLAELEKGENPKAVDVIKAAPPGALPVGSAVTASDDEKLSWMWPSDGRIVATFDEGKNKGIDIAGKMGQQVMAAGSGKVMYAGSGIRGYGNLVIVKHSNNLLSAYAHNRTILVKEGQTVTKGQAIAEMGDSDADTVKLHFEIRQQGKPVDPSKFLPSR
ncbi:peptidoglycan DD-metalloendopeptidase family protein [Massilia sp. 9096]|uniref:peptidoglycan DD-metalloendopeptidase family protein n=1 Tax=Massilia sp. 9096 TaxID=1500894 RepID=UPI00056B8F55|nr:peptidoglycan DD-metalloendopeptidase family protein [Massilia sp. 9096]